MHDIFLVDIDIGMYPDRPVRAHVKLRTLNSTIDQELREGRANATNYA